MVIDINYKTKVGFRHKQGKLLIPKELREAAGLDKDVVIAGVSERCEIWDKTRWEEYNASAEAELAETLEGLDF